MTIDQALENLRLAQEKGDPLPCPRCGHNRMESKLIRNALSRIAPVYICSPCGADEVMRDMAGQPPLPLSMWFLVVDFLGAPKVERSSHHA